MLLDDKKENLVIRATQSISEEYIKKKPLAKKEGITLDDWYVTQGQVPSAGNLMRPPERPSISAAISTWRRRLHNDPLAQGAWLYLWPSDVMTANAPELLVFFWGLG
jgi:hypothetical protein